MTRTPRFVRLQPLGPRAERRAAVPRSATGAILLGAGLVAILTMVGMEAGAQPRPAAPPPLPPPPIAAPPALPGQDGTPPGMATPPFAPPPTLPVDPPGVPTVPPAPLPTPLPAPLSASPVEPEEDRAEDRRPGLPDAPPEALTQAPGRAPHLASPPAAAAPPQSPFQKAVSDVLARAPDPLGWQTLFEDVRPEGRLAVTEPDAGGVFIVTVPPLVFRTGRDEARIPQLTFNGQKLDANRVRIAGPVGEDAPQGLAYAATIDLALGAVLQSELEAGGFAVPIRAERPGRRDGRASVEAVRWSHRLTPGADGRWSIHDRQSLDGLSFSDPDPMVIGRLESVSTLRGVELKGQVDAERLIAGLSVSATALSPGDAHRIARLIERPWFDSASFGLVMDDVRIEPRQERGEDEPGGSPLLRVDALSLGRIALEADLDGLRTPRGRLGLRLGLEALAIATPATEEGGSGLDSVRLDLSLEDAPVAALTRWMALALRGRDPGAADTSRALEGLRVIVNELSLQVTDRQKLRLVGDLLFQGAGAGRTADGAAPRPASPAKPRENGRFLPDFAVNALLNVDGMADDDGAVLEGPGVVLRALLRARGLREVPGLDRLTLRFERLTDGSTLLNGKPLIGSGLSGLVFP